MTGEGRRRPSGQKAYPAAGRGVRAPLEVRAGREAPLRRRARRLRSRAAPGTRRTESALRRRAATPPTTRRTLARCCGPTYRTSPAATGRSGTRRSGRRSRAYRTDRPRRPRTAGVGVRLRLRPRSRASTTASCASPAGRPASRQQTYASLHPRRRLSSARGSPTARRPMRRRSPTPRSTTRSTSGSSPGSAPGGSSARPARPSGRMEPHQAGWMTATLTNPDGSTVRLVDAVNADAASHPRRRRCTAATMAPFAADRDARSTSCDRGVHRDHVTAFYDGATAAPRSGTATSSRSTGCRPRRLLHHPLRLAGKARARLGLDELARSA
jgi:hypothetical protein